jgi:2,3,4,5-tetrahydropyridine-2-carboxylate N-succinyltransferase
VYPAVAEGLGRVAPGSVARVTDSPRRAWGHGLATLTDDGTVLDTWFPAPALGDAPEEDPPRELTELEYPDDRRRVDTRAVTVEADLDSPPVSTADAYLRLALLSHLLVRPNTVNLDGLFDRLPSVVWTSVGPMIPADFAAARGRLRREGVVATGLDKFPRLLDYVVPERVRIADASRVRLGAHLAPGTTVMHEGFVNYNAGTLGASMVEGRISQGVVVGDGSDIGGGASIMGTLSGGGTERVSIGRRSLLGANSGLGIAIGDDCIVEAGLYLTAGTKLTLLVPGEGARQLKARELSGQDGLLFRRNSLTGGVEALPRTGEGISLNPALHA